jgi:uncharacterized membrane protein YeaQ/YmgE (transglycosylase-associated protein family)
MPLLVLVTLGAALGWFAAIMLRHDSLRQSLTDIAAGAVGAVGGYLVTGGQIDSPAISIESLLLGALGAAALLAAAVFFRRQIAG